MINIIDNMMISIIIPTKNRADFLYGALQSLLNARTGPYDNIECLVIDNGSTDSTRSVVEGFKRHAAFRVRYIYEACPGLHVGRNLGAQLAHGNILAYLDDDVIVAPGWLAAVARNFSLQPSLALLGGPCLPKWESPPPPWVAAFKEACGDHGWVLGPLSLINYSKQRCTAPGEFIFGCNYCIRKDVIFAAGGFHPDGFPPSCLKYRGDGETGMAQWIESNGLHIIYDPEVKVEHCVPKSRMTLSYFRGIYQRNGISTGYTISRNCKCNKIALVKNSFLALKNSLTATRCAIKLIFKQRSSLQQFLRAYAHIVCFKHLLKIIFSPSLQKWVLQHTYFIQNPCPYWKK